VGAIIQVRPQLRAVVAIPDADFDRLWLLAASGQLKFCHLAFTEPYRNSALVVSVSFSNQSEQDDEGPAAVPVVSEEVRGDREDNSQCG
jgi:hypothetical protein